MAVGRESPDHIDLCRWVHVEKHQVQSVANSAGGATALTGDWRLAAIGSEHH
jgi:hypothetical protein